MGFHKQPRETTQQRPDSLPERSPLFSLIIPVRNEEENIRKCLSALCRAEFAGGLFEVIVVDNGSTDDTCKVVESFQSSLTLRILERPGIYISALRNAGAALARGRYLAFLDADCEVPAEWFAQASRAISEGICGVFGAFYVIPPESSWIARYWSEQHEQKPAGETDFLPSGNLFVSRDEFQRVGGFNETIQTNEDFEFCQRVRAAGSPVTSIPALGVIHWGTPQSLAGFFRKHRWHGMHVLRVFVGNLPALFNFKAVAFAVYTVFCAGGVVASAVWAVGTRDLRFLAASLVALGMPPALLGVRAAISSRRPDKVLPLTVLYLTYALARASCLVDPRNWVRRIPPVERSRELESSPR